MAHFDNRLLLGLAVFSLFLAAGPTGAATGDTLALGETVEPFTSATFDDKNGNTFSINLIAEQTDAAKRGVVTAATIGPAFQLCTAHGPGVSLEESEAEPGVFVGNEPLADIECGTASGMKVDIKNCVAKIAAHGYVHADHPFLPYMGSITLELTFTKTPGQQTGILKLTVAGPNDIKPTDCGGKGCLLTSGVVDMPSCP